MNKCIQGFETLLKHWKRHQSDDDPVGNELFDISPTNLYELLKSSRNPDWYEDWLFYQGMLKDSQEGSMLGREKALDDRRKKAENPKIVQERRKKDPKRDVFFMKNLNHFQWRKTRQRLKLKIKMI